MQKVYIPDAIKTPIVNFDVALKTKSAIELKRNRQVNNFLKDN